MPKTRVHRNKLAPKPTAKDVPAKVDPTLKAAWDKLAARIDDAQHRGSAAFDELWEAVGAALEHDPPLYPMGGYKNPTELFTQLLHTDPRSAKRFVKVARYATPKEEETYGVSNLDAAIDYLEEKHGPLGASLPVAFDRLKIPVKDGKTTKLVPFAKLTALEIQRATRALRGKGQTPTDRAEAAFARAFGKHPAFAHTRFNVTAGAVNVRGIPLAALGVFARVLAGVKLEGVGKK